MLLLVIPVILSLVLMLIFAGQYTRSVGRMSTIASLKPVIGEEIPEMVWRAVSGRESLEENGTEARIREVGGTIDRISLETREGGRLELVIAGRTMDTLSQYVDRIRENISRGEQVVTNEAILGEIRDVAKLVVSMLNDYITEEIGSISRMSSSLFRTVLFAAGAELLLVIFTYIVANRTARSTARFVQEPIRKLETVTGRIAEGDLSARLPVTQVEELWNLSGQVNVMADNLDSMMRQRVRDERNLKKAELRTLQAQINPHFLYNTLDAIVWKAEAGEEKEVIHLTRALSDFFRISLSSGADWIPISQEKKHIAGYLSIQQTRYRDILRYEIDIPDELGEYYILKLLLQPLVENALYHGIKFRRGGGVIQVSARAGEDGIDFTVRDTGVGMDEKTLAGLRRRMSEKQPEHNAGGGGFGLVNVNLRLRLYYNQTDGLKIESGPEGTTIRFRVPLKTREEIENDQRLSGG